MVIIMAIVAEHHEKTAISAASVTCSSSDINAQVAAEMLLHEWKSGSSGAFYWAGGMPTKKLFNVSEYDLLQKYSIESKPHASAYAFRVKSTTQGGFPITKTWEIYVKQEGDACKVYDVVEAE
jgi:hypothetical protein